MKKYSCDVSEVDALRIKAARATGFDMDGDQVSFATPTTLEAKIILGTPNSPYGNK